MKKFRHVGTPDIVNPCQDSIRFMAHWITNLTPDAPNVTILDAFAGSGSVSMAALLCRRNAIAIEIQDLQCQVDIYITVSRSSVHSNNNTRILILIGYWRSGRRSDYMGPEDVKER
jgi:16S rRNA G966 N2-methylase RsmD